MPSTSCPQRARAQSEEGGIVDVYEEKGKPLGGSLLRLGDLELYPAVFDAD
jgi:hypothetical protein